MNQPPLTFASRTLTKLACREARKTATDAASEASPSAGGASIDGGLGGRREALALHRRVDEARADRVDAIPAGP